MTTLENLAGPLPAHVERHPVESVESHLERLAEANLLTHPELLRALGSSTPRFSRRLAPATGVAPTGWTPGCSSQLCAPCLAETGRWADVWRQPMVTVCLEHSSWVLAACPGCGQAFRSHPHHRLRSVDAPARTCGNPIGDRGKPCPQDLSELRAQSADRQVLAAQARIHAAIAGHDISVLGTPTAGEDYLTEVKALAVLLLHLAVQPRGELVAEWAAAARVDAGRSVGERSARWGIAPPADPWLRGQALTAADLILTAVGIDDAADLLHPWTELAPSVPEGQLGWLGDHTHKTPTLTRLVMAATATRRRISTLLDHPPSRQLRLPLEAIPQVLSMSVFAPAAPYLAGAEESSRAYTSLCLARRHGAATSWAEAGGLLGVPPDLAVRVARTASSRMLCTPPTWIRAIDEIASRLNPGLDSGIDYRRREAVVRRLAGRSRWYRRWTRTHHPGSRSSSRRYAVIWLWTTWAGGLLAITPTCQSGPELPASPDSRVRAYYRRWAARLQPDARAALIEVAATENTTATDQQRTRRTP